MKAIHSLEIGLQSVTSGYYPIGIEWIELALEKVKHGDDTISWGLVQSCLKIVRANENHDSRKRKAETTQLQRSNSEAITLKEARKCLSPPTTMGPAKELNTTESTLKTPDELHATEPAHITFRRGQLGGAQKHNDVGNNILHCYSKQSNISGIPRNFVYLQKRNSSFEFGMACVPWLIPVLADLYNESGHPPQYLLDALEQVVSTIRLASNKKMRTAADTSCLLTRATFPNPGLQRFPGSNMASEAGLQNNWLERQNPNGLHTATQNVENLCNCQLDNQTSVAMRHSERNPVPPSTRGQDQLSLGEPPIPCSFNQPLPANVSRTPNP